MGLFGKKKKETEPDEKKPKINRDYDALGFEHDDAEAHGKKNVAFGIKAASRIHMSIFGLVGSGKSSILKLLILQNLQRGDGFMVVDPHGELARTILSIIPKSRMDDVIYINPSSIYKYGKTILINPLEVKKPEERYVVVMSFVNSLYNLYSDTWGPRLETVLRNAANALVETDKHNTLGDLTRMISNKADRKSLLKMVSSENVRNFWIEIFEKQYSKEAGSAAYNKMDKIMSTPAVAAMLDSNKSSIQISDIIKNKRMLIVDLSSGASDDIAKFLGTILLNMLYIEAKKRIDLEDEMEDITKNPFYVYVDEAHMFSNSTMSEMLRALRKFGIKMTIATQTINAYEKTFADEICGVCQTIVCGKCDHNTAKAVQASMPISVDDLQDLQTHTFAFCSAEAGVPVQGVFKSQPIPAPAQQISDWREVAHHSLKKWGETVSIEKYMRQSIVRDIPLAPLEAAIVHMLHFSDRDATREELTKALEERFGEIKSSDIMNALKNHLTRDLRYIKENRVKSDDGDGNLSMRYSIALKARETYLSHAAIGRRAGSELHLETIFQIAEIQMRMGRHCQLDLGDVGASLPDLLILEPETYKYNDRVYLSPERWNENTAIAVEVETDPTKHMEQIYKNWTKNNEMHLVVWFIVYSEKHANAIHEILASKEDVDPSSYTIATITKDDVVNKIAGNIVDVPGSAEAPGKWLPWCNPNGMDENDITAKKAENVDGMQWNERRQEITEGENTRVVIIGDEYLEQATNEQKNVDRGSSGQQEPGQEITEPTSMARERADYAVTYKPIAEQASAKQAVVEQASAEGINDIITAISRPDTENDPSEPEPIKVTEPTDYADSPNATQTDKTEDNASKQDGVGQSGTGRSTVENADRGTSEIYHLSNLEYTIYNVVNEGLSVDPVKIRERIGINALESDIRKAVNGLHKKGLVAPDLQTRRVRMESLKGGSPKKTYYRERIMVKMELVENPNTAVGQAKMIPGNKVDDTTSSKMATYSDKDLENMGRGRLNGLLRSSRTTEKQKNKISEILKAKRWLTTP